jgi:hypothetical protein
MSIQNSNSVPKKTDIDRMVQTLNDMRDALVEASLLLRDFQFSLEETGQHLASCYADAMIERIRTGEPKELDNIG